MMKINNIEFSDSLLKVHFNNGKTSELLSTWLRDHCQMPESINTQNGQRLINVTDFPLNITIKSAILDQQGHVDIKFDPEHHSIYRDDWLYENAYDINHAYDDRSAEHKKCWDGSLDKENILFNFQSYLNESDYKAKVLQAFSDYGFIILTGVEPRDEMVLKVIETFGFVRQTNYGQLFDVKTLVDANNLAYTNLGLGLHADNPYRDPTPSIQLLHCLENTVQGGESQLADGFMVAETLRRQSPEDFAILTTTWVNFRFQDKDNDLRSRLPLIEVNDLNEVVKVRFNNRSISTINVTTNKMADFYRAYRNYAQLLEFAAFKFEFKLKPGELILFDNTRIFHARNEFSTGGSRWLQGAYADLDGLYSTLNKLKNVTLS